MENNNILMSAKSCFESVVEIDYPNNFTIGSHWQDIQIKNRSLIRNCNNCEEAILYAQTGSLSGFDHRVHSAKPIVDFKITEFKRLFPSFAFEEHKDLQESMYSDKNTLEEIDGLLYSNIFLTHLNHYLRTTINMKSGIKRVIEIGGGYGSLARIFKIMEEDLTYAIIDLPESIFFAHIYLALNFPNAKIAYINQNQKIDMDNYDFALIPVQFYQALSNDEFDIVINTGSLQEMTDNAVRFWMDFIQNSIRVKMFYSLNYFMNIKKRYSEISKEESNQICPTLDPFWKMKYFKINPEIHTIDAHGRNWLELCVERLKFEEFNQEKIKEYSNKLYQSAKLHPKGSNEWFKNVWMAIWCDHREEFLLEMMDGIDKFKLGLGAKNYIKSSKSYDPESLRDTYIFNKQFIKFCIKKVIKIVNKNQHIYFGSDDYDEYHYYRKLLDKSQTKNEYV